MKTLKFIGIGAVAVAGVLFLMSSRAQTAAPAAPDKVTINEIQKTFAPVDLNHKDHVEKYKNKCVDCHHEYKEGDATVKKCSACHDPAVKKDKAPALKDAYHKACIDCHKKEVAAGKKAPTKCMECHPKKK
jgi:predicted CXXCH cytochrome family protein